MVLGLTEEDDSMFRFGSLINTIAAFGNELASEVGTSGLMMV
jgi:hypothetical protein